MSTMSTIVIPVAVALVSGVAGSGITTYGAQTKDRRDARGEARKSFTEAEDIVARTDALPREQLASLESSAFTAGIPHYLIEIYRYARDLATESCQDLEKAEAAFLGNPKDDTTEERYQEAKTRNSSVGIAASLVSSLLLYSLWHPWLAWFTRHRRCGQLRLVLADLDRERASRELETGRDRQTFVKEHIQNYRKAEREARLKEKAAQAALLSAQRDSDDALQVPVDVGPSE